MRPGDFEVYAENWAAVLFFNRLQTQWIVGGTGRRTGLNYPGVESAGRLAGVDITAEMFDQLQVMELAALEEMRKNGDS